MENLSESSSRAEDSTGGLQAHCFCFLVLGGAIGERDRTMKRLKSCKRVWEEQKSENDEKIRETDR